MTRDDIILGAATASGVLIYDVLARAASGWTSILTALLAGAIAVLLLVVGRRVFPKLFGRGRRP